MAQINSPNLQAYWQEALGMQVGQHYRKLPNSRVNLELFRRLFAVLAAMSGMSGSVLRNGCLRVWDVEMFKRSRKVGHLSPGKFVVDAPERQQTYDTENKR